ncbi:MAG: hypothetical protein ACE366_07385 [Bradymonadia bacterium]
MRIPTACIITASALILGQGCLLDTETCGPGFTEEAGRCVPRSAPPPFPGTTDGGFALPDRGVGPEFDMGLVPDTGVGFEDAGFPDADVVPENPWAQYDSVLIVDRTEQFIAEEWPFSPGVDFAGVNIQRVFDDGGLEVSGVASILGAIINDPFGQSEFTDPQVLVGFGGAAPVSLGGNGGFVWALLQPGVRPLQAGDELILDAYLFDGPGEIYDAYLCPSDAVESELPDGLLPQVGACRLLNSALEGAFFYVLPDL